MPRLRPAGGGSGHEPSHGGWVGPGMLSAAVAGDIFASPPTASVLAAILTVTGAPGCVLILKNYTGDRLNFGLAAAQARAAGIAVEIVIVGDDCALPAAESQANRRRGLAGTVLVHKVAGAAAAAGLPLAAVADEARKAAAAVGTMGLSLTSCSLPGQQDVQQRIPDGKVEIGLGIHGARQAGCPCLIPDPASSKLTQRHVRPYPPPRPHRRAGRAHDVARAR